MKKLLIGTAALAMAATLAPASFAGGHKSYTIGVSNTVQGNGWREQMICAIKAEATASGLVKEVVVVNRNGGTDLEEGTEAVDWQDALTAKGHEINVRNLNSGLHAILVGDGLMGAADPRREGRTCGCDRRSDQHLWRPSLLSLPK